MDGLMNRKPKAIKLPSQISTLIEAMSCNNVSAARLLVKKAMLISSDERDRWPLEKIWEDQDLDGVINLIQGIKPKDTIETILAAQYVSLHLKAMKIISNDNNMTMNRGISLIKLSLQALNMLQQYRGKAQTVNVNYNVHSEGDTVLNSLVQAGVKEKMDGKL